MAARWKNISDKNRHEQMLVRAALVAYSEVFGADCAARKFGVSVPCVYYWRSKDCFWWSNYHGYGEYCQFVSSMTKHRDYATYVIFE